MNVHWSVMCKGQQGGMIMNVTLIVWPPVRNPGPVDLGWPRKMAAIKNGDCLLMQPVANTITYAELSKPVNAAFKVSSIYFNASISFE